MEKKLKIHAYIICFNEEMIIKNILDYYDSICSKIFIFDNGSTDKTLDIANSYSSVKVIPFDTNGKKDNTKHIDIKTEEYKKYSRKGGAYTEEEADWVICVDADEIIYHPNLVDILLKYKNQGVTVPYITAFDMYGENEINQNTPIIEQYQLGVRHDTFDKRAIFSADFNMSYAPGCHPKGPGFELMKTTYGYSSSGEMPIALLHYKHIGSRLYQSALINHSRMDYGSDEENYRGAGQHYINFKNKGPDYKPLKGVAKPVLDGELNVLFENFAPSSGDVGVIQQAAKIEMIKKSDICINDLRDAAVALEKNNFKLAFSLMQMAQKLRPTGPFLNRKMEEYKKKLGNSK